MLTLDIELLAGRFTATSAHDYDESEWPPHPDRLFSALVATYYEGEFGDAERDVLEWLESLKPPAIQASDSVDRSAPISYVPPNDFQGVQAVPALRTTKAPRRFPTRIPDESLLRYQWEASDEEIERHGEALQRLAESLHYLGHSTTPVRACVTTAPCNPTLEPHPAGRIPIRAPRPGRLDELDFQHSIGERPDPSAAARYRLVKDELPEIPGTVWDEMVVYGFKAGDRTTAPRLPLDGAYKLTSTVRKAVMHLADDPIRSILSGHSGDGDQLLADHVAFVPLANVGHRYSDGAVLGFALVFPREIEPNDRRYVYRALEGEESLSWLGIHGFGKVSVERRPIPGRLTLKPETYRAASHTWGSVTPMVFDRFPKDKPGKRKADIVRESCARIGLPEPCNIAFHDHSVLVGVPPVHDFSVSRKAKFARRPRTHLVIGFDEPVRGPIILGAGRYFGLGLMKPWEPQ